MSSNIVEKAKAVIRWGKSKAQLSPSLIPVIETSVAEVQEYTSQNEPLDVVVKGRDHGPESSSKDQVSHVSLSFHKTNATGTGKVGKHFVNGHLYENGQLNLSKPTIQRKLDEGKAAAIKRAKEVGEGVGEKVEAEEGQGEQSK
ncbi:MAG: hypothetical protein Q9187_002572 [Circinaria calcarea]